MFSARLKDVPPPPKLSGPRPRSWTDVRRGRSLKEQEADHRRRKAAEAALTAEQSAMEQQVKDTRDGTPWGKFRKHGVPLLVFMFGSVVGGSLLAANDDASKVVGGDTEYVLEFLHDADDDVRHATLDRVMKATDANDTMKRIVAGSEHLARLLALASARDGELEERRLAVKTLEMCVRTPEAASLVLQRDGVVGQLLALVDDADAPRFVRKTSAMALVHLAKHAAADGSAADGQAIRGLVRAGVLTSVGRVLEDPDMRREEMCRGMERLASAYEATLSALGVDMDLELDAALAADVRRFSGADRARKATWRGTTDPLVESGLVMYVHTMAGGAAWGLFVGLRDRLPLAGVLRHVARTALVTGMVPAYAVGLAVSAFNYYRRGVDEPERAFHLYTASLMSLYPWYYLLPMVERFSPLWIGGHVVGFGSFFTYLVLTDSDLMKNDQGLLAKDRRQVMALTKRHQRESPSIVSQLRAHRAGNRFDADGNEVDKDGNVVVPKA